MEKIARYPGLVLFVIFLVMSIIAEFVFGITDHFFRAVICAAIAVFFAPKRKIIETNSGKKKQITWFFLKDPIIID